MLNIEIETFSDIKSGTLVYTSTSRVPWMTIRLRMTDIHFFNLCVSILVKVTPKSSTAPCLAVSHHYFLKPSSSSNSQPTQFVVVRFISLGKFIVRPKITILPTLFKKEYLDWGKMCSNGRPCSVALEAIIEQKCYLICY